MTLKPVVGFAGYFAGSDGHIYSSKPYGGNKGRGATPPLKPRRLKSWHSMENGTDDVSLYDAIGKEHNKKVHLLVCEAFHGKRPKGLVCCHGSAGRSVHRPTNLSWGTHSKNCGEDKRRDGTSGSCRGEKHYAHKLTWVQVRRIRQLSRSTPQRTLARIFKVSNANVCMIIHNRTWIERSR
jgi:hypothetical protein